jgi:hypothetical protein
MWPPKARWETTLTKKGVSPGGTGAWRKPRVAKDRPLLLVT